MKTAAVVVTVDLSVPYDRTDPEDFLRAMAIAEDIANLEINTDEVKVKLIRIKSGESPSLDA
jgi:hypothetical protein